MKLKTNIKRGRRQQFFFFFDFLLKSKSQIKIRAINDEQ